MKLVTAILFFATTSLAVEAPISTRVPGPTSVGLINVGLAHLGDGYLGLWIEGSECDASVELRGMRFDRQLRTLDARSFFIGTASPYLAIIGAANDGDSAYVAWVGDRRFHVARIDPDGSVTHLNDDVPFDGGPVALRVSRGTIAFLATDSLKHAGLSMTLLDRTGAVIASNVTILDRAAIVTEADFVVARDRFVIAWTGGDYRVRTTGVLLSDVLANRVAIPAAPGNTNGSEFYIRLASSGNHVAAFWYDVAALALRARPLSAEGDPVGPDVTVGRFSPHNAILATAASDGYRLFFAQLVNNVDELMSLHVGFDGTLISTGHNTQGAVPLAVVADGDATVAVHRDLLYSTLNYGRYQAVASTIEADGSFGPGTLLSLSLPVQHVRRLIPFRDGAAALWTQSIPNDQLFVGRVNAAGTPRDGTGVRLFETANDQYQSEMATDGDRLAVAWIELTQTFQHPLYVAIVSFGDAPAVSVRQLANDADTDGLGISRTGANYVVTYHRTIAADRYEFAALRLDRVGNPIDPAPVSLMPAGFTAINPRLVSNGSDALLLWEEWYDPFFHLPEPAPCTSYLLPNDLYAQRFSASLTPIGSRIPLATTTDYGDYVFDAEGDEISFGSGIWMVSWIDKHSGSIAFSRIDASGRALDPMNGRNLIRSCNLPHVTQARDGGWMLATIERCDAPELALLHVGADGKSTNPVRVPLPGIATLEAFTLAPLPIVAYTKNGSTAAYVNALPQHPRPSQH